MRMIPVSSSNLVSVGYDDQTGTLVVQFYSGRYAYSNVPKSIFQGLLNASSKGQYHHRYIKNNYPYRKIG